MLVDRKPFIYVWRPLYRSVFDGLIWPFIARIKSFYFEESARNQAALLANDRHILELLNGIEARQSVLTSQLQQINERLAVVERDNVEQWAPIEQLLLCLLRDPVEFQPTAADTRIEG